MSDISDALATALSVLADAKGESLQYRTGDSGSWTDLSGWVIHPQRKAVPYSEEREMVEMQDHDAVAKGPIGSPAFAVGYQINHAAHSEVYAVLGVKLDQQQILTLKRITAGVSTPNRGGAA